MSAADQGVPRRPGCARSGLRRRTVGRPAPAEFGVRPWRAGARRLRRRRGVLGRLQHRAGSHQHREVLHRLPRDARQRVRGAEIDDPFLQPLRRARDLPGLPRAARLDRQDRAQDAGVEGGLGPSVRHDRYAREIRRSPARTGAARMGALEGQRLAGMPQLPQRRVDGHHPAVATRAQPRISASCSPSEKTCIDCHKGIAHQLPDMRGVPGWQ